MAEAALASIAKSALQLFTSLAKDEFLLLWNSQKELKKLEATIEIITNIHQDTQERGSKDGSVQHCLSKLRNVMYDAEDLFDALAAQVLHKRTTSGNVFKKEVRLFFSESNQLGVIFKTAHKVKAIRESLDDIKKDVEIYGLIRQQPPAVPHFMRAKYHSFVHDEDVIGRDQDRDRIINMLLPQYEGETSDDRSFSVIAIIGFGGLGKTTLAQYVYNHERVEGGFDVNLWACINDLSNLEQVLIEIIASKERRYSDLGLEKLQEKLREIISGRKFLLVLDDVWDENPGNWLHLETILRCGKIGSRVLVTTRSRKVGECLDASEPCCVDLAVLSEENAWSLFVKKAFRKDELSEHPELEPLGKKIVRRCGYVPLAIIVVGSLLRHREKKEKAWSDFLDNELKKTLSSSDDKNHRSIKDVLMLSYNDLLPSLKLCFAYCSLFPKDGKFDKDELVCSWIAQGFIKPSDGNEQSLEEVGEAYFFHLVERCFFQEVKVWKKPTFLGKVDRFGITTKIHAKMHDLLHDVAIDVAKSETFLLDKVSMINGGQRDGVRHISIRCDIDDSLDYCSLVSDPERVRTLVIHPEIIFSKYPLNVSISRFRMLRTLRMACLKTDGISESIGELIHLRYLDLSNNERLKHLPNSISKLHHLMILVLMNCTLLEELPPKIENLVSLRQLYIHGCESLSSLPSGLIALASLVNLDRLIVHRDTGGLRYLQGQDNLRGVVRIELPDEGWADAIEDAGKANMSRKCKLSGMVIEWNGNSIYRGAQSMDKEEARAVLDALEPHKNLEYLKISNYGGEKLSSWFCTLKNVTELCLYGCGQLEYLEDEIRGDLYFPSLKILKLESLRNLRGWWRQEAVEETELPRLTKVSVVHISYCRQLIGRMPVFEEIEDLTLVKVNLGLLAELLGVNPNRSSTFHRNYKLKNLKLDGIERLIRLREVILRQFTNLQSLHVQSCHDLKVVSRRGLAHLTTLKDLSLEHGEIRGIEEEEDGGMEITEAAGMPWKAFKGLELLKVATQDEHLIEGLQYLTTLKYLQITSWKEGEVDLPSQHLQNLISLSIGFDNKTTRLPKAIIHLRSLEGLSIENCKELYLGWKTLFGTKLKRLTLFDVESVIDVDDMVVEQQSQLHKVSIVNGAKWVEDIPWKSLASVVELKLIISEKVEMNIPDGIQHLTSLRSLWMEGCGRSTSLPNWFPRLTFLTALSMWRCSPELKRRCDEEGGEDRPLIRHVHYIHIRASGESFLRNPNHGEAVNESREQEAEASRKMGFCGLTLSKFNHKPALL